MNRFVTALRAALIVTPMLLLGACGSEPEDEMEPGQRIATAESNAEPEVAVEEPPAMPEVAPEAGEDSMADAGGAPDDATAMNEEAGSAGAASEPAAAGSGDPCVLSVEVGDNIAYSTTEMSVPASCGEVTVNLTHTGQLPVSAMGHNWVLVAADEMQSVAQAGVSAGLDAGYLPADDERVVAATELVGGGESTSVTFSLDQLAEGTEYMYVCTFPGHWMVMQGSFAVTG